MLKTSYLVYVTINRKSPFVWKAMAVETLERELAEVIASRQRGDRLVGVIQANSAEEAINQLANC
jgi:hypothetical protein